MRIRPARGRFCGASRLLKSFTIGGKIYSIALGLVILMVAVSAASLYMVDRVREELQLQSTIFLPLSNRVASIEAKVLDGEVHIERLRHALEEGRQTLVSTDIHRKIQQIGVAADEEFQRAYAILESIDQAALSKDSAVAAAQVEAALHSLDTEYRDYRMKLERMLAAELSGAVSNVQLLNELLIQDEQQIYEHAERVRAQMQDHVSASLNHVVELDEILDRLIFILTGLAALLGLLLSALVTRWIVTPMRALVSGLKRVEDGDLETELRIDTRDETAAMARSFNEMIAGLRAKERITETFGKYVDARVVNSLIGNPALTKPGGDRRHMTVLFTDMSGFTGLSEALSPDLLVRLLNEYFTEMSDPIIQREGVIDKYIGDAIMAYWGPPFTDPAHQSEWACAAALDQLDRLEGFRKAVPDIIGVKLQAEPIDIHSGIASGPALVGTVGSHQHRNYTVMGDTVNLAARLEGACKAYKVRILVDEATKTDCKDVLFREVDFLRVKGRGEPVRAYQPLSRLPASDTAQSLVKYYSDGLSAYRMRDFQGAVRLFEKCLEITPGDPPSQVLLERATALRDTPPPDGWDGVWEMRSK